MRSPKAQLASEQGGRGKWGWREVSAADLLWLLPSPARHKLATPNMAPSRVLFSFPLSRNLWPHSTWPQPKVVFLWNRLGTVLARFAWAPTAPALPRAAATATAAGAAPPPCQLLGCNGDWAAAAEVTPGRGSGAGPAPEETAESRSSGGGLLWGRGGSLSASPSVSAARRIPGASARRAPGASPERGGQARQPWGRSGRHHCTLRQAPRDAPWEPRAEATLSGEPREDVAGTADPRLAAAASPRSRVPGGGERGGAGRREPWPSLASPSGNLPMSRVFAGRAILSPGFQVPPVPAEDGFPSLPASALPAPSPSSRLQKM